MTAAQQPGPALSTPGLGRRMAAFVYEGVLLFGVLFVAGYLYSALTQQRHALQGQSGLQVFVFLVLAVYFVVFWTRGGQTVAMKAWHVRVVTVDDRPLSQPRALARYVASWIWFVPALAAAWLANLNRPFEIFSLMFVGVIAYALLSFAHPQRQFWHDALCGTRPVQGPHRHRPHRARRWPLVERSASGLRG
jgi:uncharacterized RDD family membrane protein YckC